jgi:hypothetical protein
MIEAELVDDHLPEHIVAEISKNWVDGRELEPLLLSQRFERAIEFNRRRGYRLQTFALCRVLVPPNGMNETILAVFERVRG